MHDIHYSPVIRPDYFHVVLNDAGRFAVGCAPYQWHASVSDEGPVVVGAELNWGMPLKSPLHSFHALVIFLFGMFFCKQLKFHHSGALLHWQS